VSPAARDIIYVKGLGYVCAFFELRPDISCVRFACRVLALFCVALYVVCFDAVFSSALRKCI
jgi:hypothetical protein